MPAYDPRYHPPCDNRNNFKASNDEGQIPCEEYYQGRIGIYIVNKGVPIEFIDSNKLKELQRDPT